MEDCIVSSGNIVINFDDINAQIMEKVMEDLNKPPKIENVGVMNFDGTMAYTLKKRTVIEDGNRRRSQIA